MIVSYKEIERKEFVSLHDVLHFHYYLSQLISQSAFYTTISKKLPNIVNCVGIIPLPFLFFLSMLSESVSGLFKVLSLFLEN